MNSKHPALRLFLFILLFYCGHGILGQELTTIILVRHAEKEADGTPDPSLTEKGKLRAERLAYLLNSQPIETIYTTHFSRNTSTIYPVAQLKGVVTKIYEPHQKGFVKDLVKEHAGKTVLVCGHSNTVPFMVNELLGEKLFEQLGEDDYDDIFIVTVTEVGNGTFTIINY